MLGLLDHKTMVIYSLNSVFSSLFFSIVVSLVSSVYPTFSPSGLLTNSYFVNVVESLVSYLVSHVIF